MFLRIIFVIFYLFQKISCQGESYDTSCICIRAATNGSFCWEWKCRTDQVTKCFPGDTTVEIMQTGEYKMMKNLNIGDKILVDIDNQGKRIYEPIYSFIHANSYGIYDYLKISIENSFQKSLIISSNHLIYRYNQPKPIFAGYLKIGDQLQIILKNGSKISGIINDIKLIKSQGFYAPLTSSGKLIVNGIIVSNYATVANHQLAHLIMQPYRWWIEFFGSSLYSENIHWYCQILYNIVEKINKWLFSIQLYDGTINISSF